MNTFRKIETGYQTYGWGVKIEKKGNEELMPGQKITVTKKDGTTTTVTLGCEFNTNTSRGYVIWTIQRS
jgi:hypothetical protein